MKNARESLRVAVSGLSVALIGLGLVIFAGPGYAILFGMLIYLVLLVSVFGRNPMNLDRLILGKEAAQEIRNVGRGPGGLSIALKVAFAYGALFMFAILIFLLTRGYF